MITRQKTNSAADRLAAQATFGAPAPVTFKAEAAPGVARSQPDPALTQKTPTAPASSGARAQLAKAAAAAPPPTQPDSRPPATYPQATATGTRALPADALQATSGPLPTVDDPSRVLADGRSSAEAKQELSVESEAWLKDVAATSGLATPVGWDSRPQPAVEAVLNDCENMPGDPNEIRTVTWNGQTFTGRRIDICNQIASLKAQARTEAAYEDPAYRAAVDEHFRQANRDAAVEAARQTTDPRPGAGTQPPQQGGSGGALVLLAVLAKFLLF